MKGAIRKAVGRLWRREVRAALPQGLAGRMCGGERKLARRFELLTCDYEAVSVGASANVRDCLLASVERVDSRCPMPPPSSANVPLCPCTVGRGATTRFLHPPFLLVRRRSPYVFVSSEDRARRKSGFDAARVIANRTWAVQQRKSDRKPTVRRSRKVD